MKSRNQICSVDNSMELYCNLMSLPVCSPGGEEAEEWEVTSTSEAWEPDERPAAAVWRQRPRTPAAAGLDDQNISDHTSWGFTGCAWLLKAVCLCVSEWEMPPADWTWDPETEGAGWGTQPGAEGVAREAPTQEEGTAQQREGFPLPPFSHERMILLIYTSVEASFAHWPLQVRFWPSFISRA